VYISIQQTLKKGNFSPPDTQINLLKGLTYVWNFWYSHPDFTLTFPVLPT
jgi:hypothetical protein